MIRIDEIYNNIFLPRIRPGTGLHWFDPFGSVDFNHLCNLPPVPDTDQSERYLFWDQEPLHQDTVTHTLNKFVNMFARGKRHIITSEHDSENVRQIVDTYGFQPHYYFFHAWAALDWYRGYDRAFLAQPFRLRNIDNTFLCPNNIIGGRRKHRLALLNELVDRQLLHNLISFPAKCPYEQRTVQDLCAEYQIDLGAVDLPLVIDQPGNHAANSHRIDLWSSADRSLLQVVTETVYTGRRHHLTEKTFKPIVMQQPFILVSCQGSLEYLRSYGFQTFSDFWSEDYDQADDAVRIVQIGKLLADIDALSQPEKLQLQKHMAHIVEHNFRWFYSQEFECLLWGELTGMINGF